jgi:hypothetical protein
MSKPNSKARGELSLAEQAFDKSIRHIVDAHSVLHSGGETNDLEASCHLSFILHDWKQVIAQLETELTTYEPKQSKHISNVGA